MIEVIPFNALFWLMTWSDCPCVVDLYIKIVFVTFRNYLMTFPLQANENVKIRVISINIRMIKNVYHLFFSLRNSNIKKWSIILKLKWYSLNFLYNKICSYSDVRNWSSEIIYYYKKIEKRYTFIMNLSQFNFYVHKKWFKY